LVLFVFVGAANQFRAPSLRTARRDDRKSRDSALALRAPRNDDPKFFQKFSAAT
jgi:hypothetical protein